MMKQLVIAVLSLHLFVAGLMPAGNVLELAKLPVLISHYQQQHATNSVWRFLYDHYAGRHNQEHQRDHAQLPLHCCLHQAVALALPPTLRLLTVPPLPLEFPVDQQYRGEYVASAPRGISRPLFQPPRPVAAFAASRA
ncbi:hypothetical protein LJ737_12300 [Hymenobacter sp. 15J16-1T3B]|uniref:hypothetical protein n=1 Tax=Hymenobacter sp. 15J16-1T3B TaxID=2886941 RepID=UPI001D12C8F4|nr:hypothetical protein [Hymenobacter sp. 15J16-1T3B]MCC3158022.1 hypothetical protein [Hymenobacter sp. 15J16-1T3B]